MAQFQPRPVQFQSAQPTNRPLALRVPNAGTLLGDLGKALFGIGGIPGQIDKAKQQKQFSDLVGTLLGQPSTITEPTIETEEGDVPVGQISRPNPVVVEAESRLAAVRPFLPGGRELPSTTTRVRGEEARATQAPVLASREDIAAGVQTGAGERQVKAIKSTEEIAAGVQTGAGKRLGRTIAGRKEISEAEIAGREKVAGVVQTSTTNRLMKKIEADDKLVSKQIASKEEIALFNRQLKERLQAREFNFKQTGLDIKEDQLKQTTAIAYARIKSNFEVKLRDAQLRSNDRKERSGILQQGIEVRQSQVITNMEKSRTRLEEDIIRVLRSDDSVAEQLVQLEGLSESLNENARRLNKAANTEIYDTNLDFTSEAFSILGVDLPFGIGESIERSTAPSQQGQSTVPAPQQGDELDTILFGK